MLSPAEIAAKLKATRAYGLKLPQANGKSGSVASASAAPRASRSPSTSRASTRPSSYYGQAPTDAPAPARGAPPAPYQVSDRVAT